MRKKYLTEEERKAAHREQQKRWRKNNLEKAKEIVKKYREKNKDKISKQKSEWLKIYRSTQLGRAYNLINGYRQNDKKYNRGKCTLTVDWMLENVFNGQTCHYCGKTDWTKLGCDRIDNSLPHTPDNCVPCCCDCNKKKARYGYDGFMKMIGKV